MNLTYREENGRLYPNLELPEQTNYNIGQYGLLHLDFIKEHRKGRYSSIFALNFSVKRSYYLFEYKSVSVSVGMQVVGSTGIVHISVIIIL